VISDKANRLKGNRTRAQLDSFSRANPECCQDDYRMVVTYLDREHLLAEVRHKATQGGRPGEEWAKIATFLDRIFSRSIIATSPRNS
jgi:hypothetical protein